MSGHTPEEWGVWPEINTFNVDGKMITGNTTGMHIAHVRICGGEGERYARLMAAAPRTLFCLRQIVDSLPANRDWLDPDVEREAKATIAEQDGRS